MWLEYNNLFQDICLDMYKKSTNTPYICKLDQCSLQMSICKLDTVSVVNFVIRKDHPSRQKFGKERN